MGPEAIIGTRESVDERRDIRPGNRQASFMDVSNSHELESIGDLMRRTSSFGLGASVQTKNIMKPQFLYFVTREDKIPGTTPIETVRERRHR